MEDTQGNPYGFSGAKPAKKKAANPYGLTPAQLKSINKLIGPGTKGASALANALFGQNSLGSVSSGLDSSGNRVKENADIVQSYQNSLAGYNSEQVQAMREQAAQQIQGQYNTSMYQSQLANAKAGVRGGAASANQQDANQRAVSARGNLERDLVVKQADESYRRLGDYNDIVQKMRADELERQKFNLGQRAAEKSGQYATFFGALGLGQTKKQQAAAQGFNQQLLSLYAQQIKKGGAGGMPVPTAQQPTQQ